MRINQSLQEIGDTKYTVERSTDGKTFNALGEIQGFAKPAEYSYLDKNPVMGANYYRVQISEAGGHNTYSKLVQANNHAPTSIQAFPNPVSEILTLIVGGNARKGSIIITDMAGRVIIQTEVVSGIMKLDVSKYPAGNYILKYEYDNVRQVIRLIKL